MRILRLGSLRGMGLLAAVLLGLADCGGGSHSAVPAPPGGPTTSSYQYAPATFIIGVPKQAASTSDKRSPRYISAATQSIKVNVTTVNGSPATTTPSITNVTSCPTDPGNTGNFKCTVSASLPLGADTLSIGTYDQTNAGGNLISQQFTTVTVLQGTANGPPAAGYTFTLDANPSTITVAPPGTGVVCPHNPIQASDACTINGTSGLAFTVTVNDAHGAGISNNSIPGSPKLSATSGTAAVASVSAAQSPYAVTVTPTGTSGSSLITVTAKPSTTTSQLASTQFQFTVQTVPTLIALGEANLTPQGQINIYTLPGTTFTSYGVIPPAALGSFEPATIEFDTNNKLYMFDNNSNVILEFAPSQLSLSGGQTFTTISSGITGIVGQGLASVFSLAPDGTMAVGNAGSTSTLNQLVVFSAGATSPSVTRAFGCATPCYRAGATAVLTNSSGTPFAYGVALASDNGAASTGGMVTSTGKIGIISTTLGAVSGSSASTCNVTCYELDLTSEAGGAIGTLNTLPGLVWNNHNQELVFFDNTTGKITAYPFSGSAFGTPVLIGSYISADSSMINASYAVSRDGHLAVASADISGNTHVTIYDASHAIVAAWNGKTFAPSGSGFVVSGMAFLPNDELLIAGGYSTNQLFAFTLGNATTTADATITAPLAGSQTSGVASSGQSARRRPMGIRRQGILWRQ